MQNNANRSALSLVPWVSEGTVVDTPTGGGVSVALKEGEVVAASTAVSAGDVRKGDRVLVLGNGALDGSSAFVVALLARAVPVLHVSDGAAAVVERDERGAEALRVRDPQGALLFEYDPATGRAVASLPHGNVALRAETGRLELYGAAGVSIESAKDVRVRGGESVALEQGSAEGKIAQRLGLDVRGLGVVTNAVTAIAGKVQGRFGDASASFRTVSTTAKTVRQTADVIETKAGRIIERAKSTFRDVEELAQERLGRARTLVRDSWHTTAKRVTVGAAEDVKIDGQKIRLG